MDERDVHLARGPAVADPGAAEHRGGTSGRSIDHRPDRSGSSPAGQARGRTPAAQCPHAPDHGGRRWPRRAHPCLVHAARVLTRFGLATAEQAAIVRSFAYNQGFYNLFLAVGVGLGLALVATGNPGAGAILVVFACGSMVAAGVVLFLHNRRFLRAAAIQVGPAFVAVLGGLFLGATGG